MSNDDIERRVTVLEVKAANTERLVQEIADDTKIIRKQLNDAAVAAALQAGKENGERLANALLKRDRMAIYASLLVALVSLVGTIVARLL